MAEAGRFSAEMVGFDPQPDPPGRVRVYVSAETHFNLEKMQRVTANVLGRLGCEGCHSGYDIRYIQLRDFVANPKTLDVKEVVGQPGL